MFDFFKETDLVNDIEFEQKVHEASDHINTKFSQVVRGGSKTRSTEKKFMDALTSLQRKDS